MDYVLLTPDEVGALLSLERDDILALVESGELASLRIAGHWRIPLKSVTTLLAAGMRSQTARALERVFREPDLWSRVFGDHPEVTRQIEAGEFPTGSVGARLKEAIALQGGLIRPGAATGQDPVYGSPEPDDQQEAATG